jgi:hypothetical protein
MCFEGERLEVDEFREWKCELEDFAESRGTILLMWQSEKNMLISVSPIARRPHAEPRYL